MTETSEAEHRMQCAKGVQLLLIVNVAGLATAARSDWRTAYSTTVRAVRTLHCHGKIKIEARWLATGCLSRSKLTGSAVAVAPLSGSRVNLRDADPDQARESQRASE